MPNQDENRVSQMSCMVYGIKGSREVKETETRKCKNVISLYA